MSNETTDVTDMQKLVWLSDMLDADSRSGVNARPGVTDLSQVFLNITTIKPFESAGEGVLVFRHQPCNRFAVYCGKEIDGTRWVLFALGQAACMQAASLQTEMAGNLLNATFNLWLESQVEGSSRPLTVGLIHSIPYHSTPAFPARG